MLFNFTYLPSSNWARRAMVIVSVLVFVILLGLFIKGFSKNEKPKTCSIAVRDCFDFEYANTPEAREQGLSGRSHLASNTGMVFVFEQPQLACLWMKDMKFPLDIIWLDDDKRIVHIKEYVPPATYPESFCHDGTRYVIEANVGTVQKAGLKTGQQINF